MLSPQINIHRPSNSSFRSAKSQTKGPGQGQGNPPANQQPSSPATQGGGTSLFPTRSRENSQNISATSSPRTSINNEKVQIFPLVPDETIYIQWPEKPIEKAPELDLLYKRPSAFHVYSGDCFSKFIRAITSLCKNFNRVGDSALANYKPVSGRTDHTLEYVNDLAREYAINLKYGSQTNITGVVIKTPSGSSVQTHNDDSLPKVVRKLSGTSSTRRQKRTQQTLKNQLLREFYEKSYRTLSIIQQCIGQFRTLVYTLTFSRYSEEDLTDSEAKLIRGKSIIGSCIWIVTYALQQLQEDPEVEISENMSKTNSDVTQLALDMYSLINLSLNTWNDIVQVINVLERMYKRTEEVFNKQNNYFITKAKPDSDIANAASVHMREYRRSPDGDLDTLRNFKGFDPYASLLNWGAVKRQAPARILYLTDYTNPESLWCGFDPLSLERKSPYLKDVMNFIRLVLESVRDNIQNIMISLQGQSFPFNETTPVRKPNPQFGRQQTYHFSGITCYEEGIEAMNDVLSKKLANVEWNLDEMHEFFEIDKIFLDDMDLLSLGAAVSRAIIFEARHTMHLCYETCRLLDYKEFTSLPSYEKIYHKIKEMLHYTDEKPSQFKPGFRRRSRKSSLGYNQFELAEIHLDLRNVAGLFRTSQYREILKNLPVYTNNIGITLQDAEMVFTASSEKLLS